MNGVVPGGNGVGNVSVNLLAGAGVEVTVSGGAKPPYCLSQV